MRIETTTHADGSRTEYAYDDNDRHIRTTDYNEDGSPSVDIHYQFDEHGRPSGWRVLTGRGTLIRRFAIRYGGDRSQEILEYDEYDSLLTRTLESFTPGGKPTRLIYNADGTLIDEQVWE